MEYIAYNAGCNIWELSKFDKTIHWHLSEYRGTLQDCKNECSFQMEQANKSYNDEDYLIG